jgi:RsiW-degrading membrane proteinase PrsW (M82 family)
MPDAAASGQAQRQPPIQQLLGAIAFMSTSANNESKRSGDTANAILLPISCALLVAAICLANTPQLKALGFALPLITFSYYISIRIGIVKTFTSRQAYLTWHILIATFLLGGTTSLFLVYVGTTIMLMVTNR